MWYCSTWVFKQVCSQALIQAMLSQMCHIPYSVSVVGLSFMVHSGHRMLLRLFSLNLCSEPSLPSPKGRQQAFRAHNCSHQTVPVHGQHLSLVLNPKVLCSVEEWSLDSGGLLQRRARTLKTMPLTQGRPPYFLREAARLHMLSGCNGRFPVLHSSDIACTAPGRLESLLCLRFAACLVPLTLCFPAHCNCGSLMSCSLTVVQSTFSCYNGTGYEFRMNCCCWTW